MSIREDLDRRYFDRMHQIFRDHVMLYRAAELEPVAAIQDAFVTQAYMLMRLSKVARIKPEELAEVIQLVFAKFDQLKESDSE